MWKKIIFDGCETIYSISEQGEVRNDSRNKCLSQHLQNGYFYITLSINKKPKRITVHRLVAMMFVENPFNKDIVNHIDGNKQNNHYTNLEWVTQQENTQHAWDTGLAKSVVERAVNQYSLTGEFIATYKSITKAAHNTNSAENKISLCCSGQRLSHNNYQWRYVDSGQDVLKNHQITTKAKEVGMYKDEVLVKTFKTTAEAARYVNGTQSAISRCCNNKAKTHKGFVWKFIG